MNMTWLPAGLRGIAVELESFASMLRFDRPNLLWLVLLPLLLWPLVWWAKRRAARHWQRLGDPIAILHLVRNPHPMRRGAVVGRALIWLALVIAVAGPRFGAPELGGVSVGRDLILVLDFSKSMWAEDVNQPNPMTRSDAARAAARTLFSRLRQTGGHRVGIVIFAARPMLVAPLTSDLDHLEAILEVLDATTPPAEIRPTDDSRSGTRIGAALQTAVAAHDPRFPGFQEILLLSDGDDPADDREWQTGITAARGASIPVHVVGFGDATRDSWIVQDGLPIEATDAAGIRAPILTRLNTANLEAIATEARGAYLPAGQTVPDLGEFFRTTIEPQLRKETADDQLPQPPRRAGLFAMIALVGLLFIWYRG